MAKRHLFPATMASADETITKAPESQCILGCEFCRCVRTSTHCQCEGCIACSCLGCAEHRARQKILLQKMAGQSVLLMYFFPSTLYLFSIGAGAAWLCFVAIMAASCLAKEWILSSIQTIEPDDVFCRQTRSQRARVAGKPRHSAVLPDGQTVRFIKTG